MENNDLLKRILLNINYDSRKTLSENENILELKKRKNLLNEQQYQNYVIVDNDKLTLTINVPHVDFENTKDKYPEMRLFKGTTFTKNSSNNLVTTNQKYQLVSDNMGDDRGSGYGTITYYCYTNNLDIGGRTDEYKDANLFWQEDWPYVDQAFKDLCKVPYKPKTKPAPKPTIDGRTGTCTSGNCVDGEGTFMFDDGDSWTGKFTNGKIEGYGTRNFTDGSKYVGYYKNNYRNGEGTYTSANGHTYGGKGSNWVDGYLTLNGKKFGPEDFEKWSTAAQNKPVSQQTTVVGGGSQPVSKPVSQLKDCPTGPYSYGCKGENVKKMQECLKTEGLYKYRVDGEFLKRTLQAVKSKLNKDTFTDEDINTVCKTKVIGGGGENKPGTDIFGGGEIKMTGGEEPYTWSGQYL